MSVKRFSVLLCAFLVLLCALAPAAFAAKPLAVTLDPVISGSSVTLKGAIISDEAVTEAGFLYGAARAKLNQKSVAQSSAAPEVTLTILEPDTTYYVQLYAKNASGESLGEIVSFKTLSDEAVKAAEQTAAPEANPESAAAYAEKIKSEFGIQIHYKSKRSEWNHLLNYKAASGESEALKGLKMVYGCLSKYPSGFLSKIKLKYIALASEIAKKDGVQAEGIAMGNTQQTMVMVRADADESVLHHELFHAYEYAFSLRFGDWDRANMQTGLYDKSLKKSYDLLPPGFVTHYAMSSAEEDRADVFMYMMTDGLKDQLVAAAAHDPFIQDKVKRISASLDLNLGKSAQNARWKSTASAVAKAELKKLGTVNAAGAAKLYSGPDTQQFSLALEVPDGTELDVVQTGSRWYKVMYASEVYYVPISSVGALAAPPGSSSGSGNYIAPVSKKEAEALLKRLSDNHGIAVSELDAKADFGSFTAGAVRKNGNTAALIAEYEALLTSGAKMPPGITNIVVCRSMRSSSGAFSAHVENHVLFLSQDIPLGGALKELLSQY